MDWIDENEKENQIYAHIQEISIQRQKSLDDFFISRDMKMSTPFSQNVKPMITLSNQAHPLLGYKMSQNRYQNCYNTDILSKFHLADVEFSPLRYVDGRTVYSRTGISVCRFDPDGVLFAVGSSNGVVQIFDFDECLASMQSNRKDNLEPIIIYDAKKDISDIQWSCSHHDVIVISFSFHSHILVINLNDTSQSQTILETGRDVSGGYSSLLLLPSWTEPTHEKVIVGGTTNGIIRMWDNIHTKKKSVWEILADPNSNLKISSPVVSLLLIHQGEVKGGFISVDSSGIIVLWDCKHVVYSAFGSTGIPTCLRRIDLFHVLSRNTMDSNKNNNNNLLLLNIYDQRVIRVHNTENREFSLMATLSGGSVVEFSLQHDKIRQIYRGISQSVKRYDPFHQLIDETIPMIFCPASFFHHSHHHSVGKASHSILLLHQHVPSNGLSLSMISSKRNTYQRNQSHYSTDYVTRRCLEYNCILPIHILVCESGGLDILLSHDIRDYFVSSSLASNCPSKSHQIYFDWKLSCDRNSDISSDRFETNGCLCEISSIISGNHILLSTPYIGPTISIEYPNRNIQIRTNLSFEFHTKIQTSHHTITATKCLTDDAVSTITCHPSLPYAIIGFSTNRLKILSADIGKNGNDI